MGLYESTDTWEVVFFSRLRKWEVVQTLVPWCKSNKSDSQVQILVLASTQKAVPILGGKLSTLQEFHGHLHVYVSIYYIPVMRMNLINMQIRIRLSDTEQLNQFLEFCLARHPKVVC